MSPPPDARPLTRFERWSPALICLLVAGFAFWAMRSLDAPWTGHTGRVIFQGKAAQMDTLERYREVWHCYLDSAHPAREKFDLDDWRIVGLWCGSFFALLAALAAAALAPWWGRWIRRPGDGTGEPVGGGLKPTRLSLAVLALAMAGGTYLRVQTIDNAPFWDEQDNMRRNFHGQVEYRSLEQPPVWKPAGIQGAIWENTRGNNPYLYSVLSQLSHKIWRAASGAAEERYNVVAMRMPSVIFGVLAIAALWWSLHRMGLARVAPWAALLLAVNGLAIEFSVEARGYGVAMFTSAMLLGLAWAAMHGGRARVWPAYGLTIFCSLLAYPGSLYMVACVNLLVAGVLAWRGWKTGDATARAGLARWTVTNCAAAVAYFWVLAPAMPQAAQFYNTKFPTGEMRLIWHIGFYLSYASGLCPIFAKGVAVSDWQGQSAFSWLFGGFWKLTPLAVWSLVVFPAMFVAGAVWMARAVGGRMRVLQFSVVIFSGVLMILVQPRLTKDAILYFWYIIYITPAVIAFAAAGLAAAGDWLAARVTGGRLEERWGAVPATVAVTWLVLMTSSRVAWYGWEDEIAGFARKPVTNFWEYKPGMIPRFGILRGKNYWVNYADGYLVSFWGYEGKEVEWSARYERPLDQWGKLDGLQREKSGK